MSGALPRPSAAARTTQAGLTPFQPTGPYPQVMLDLPTGHAAPLTAGARGARTVIEGTLLDGAGAPVFDAMIESWQADASGRYHHPHDPQTADADTAFWGYRRVATDSNGRFRLETVKPGARDGQAPHLLMAIYGGGILYRYVTRCYFGDEPANDTDPVLALVPPHRRQTLIARGDGAGRYEFTIRLQGAEETVFFDI